jgi:hypothetical protein
MKEVKGKENVCVCLLCPRSSLSLLPQVRPDFVSDSAERTTASGKGSLRNPGEKERGCYMAPGRMVELKRFTGSLKAPIHT